MSRIRSLPAAGSTTQSISSVDKSDCGKLYLCEISATPPSKLLREDQNTLDLLRRTYGQVGILRTASLIIKLFTKIPSLK